MASEDEAASKLKAWRTAEHRKGTDTELLTISSSASHPTKLLVLCGDQFEASKAFRAGDFSVRIIRLSGNPVSMVTCMVGDHQWMLAKDSMALRVGARSFVFALPGLLYGLALPSGQLEKQCRMLEEIFSSFCAYQDLVGKDGSKSGDPKPECGNWSGAYAKILSLATKNSTKIANATAAAAGPSAKSSSPSAELTLKRIQRAVRMSAAVKLVSRALLSGALVPDRHLHVSVAPGAMHAYPTMWAVADIPDAIEAGRPMGRVVRRAHGQGFWGFEEEGLGMLLDVVKAYGGVSGADRVRKRRRGGRAEESEGGMRREVGGSPMCSGGSGGGGGGMGKEVEKRVGTCGKS